MVENKNSSYVQAKFCGKCDKKVTFFTVIVRIVTLKTLKLEKLKTILLQQTLEMQDGALEPRHILNTTMN